MKKRLKPVDNDLCKKVYYMSPVTEYCYGKKVPTPWISREEYKKVVSNLFIVIKNIDTMQVLIQNKEEEKIIRNIVKYAESFTLLQNKKVKKINYSKN